MHARFCRSGNPRVAPSLIAVSLSGRFEPRQNDLLPRLRKEAK